MEQRQHSSSTPCTRISQTPPYHLTTMCQEVSPFLQLIRAILPILTSTNTTSQAAMCRQLHIHTLHAAIILIQAPPAVVEQQNTHHRL
uniref:Uncharacterized protein n=1 Tax=Arundo donax TaxID=35708 RepID=A0A0A9DG95_ARUDO